MEKSTVPIYDIVYPKIKSGNEYFFTTDSGIEYEVRFGRKQQDILSATIVFGVLNDEFDGEEYAVTNKGEVYRVISTIVTIVNIYKREHPNIHSYEFTGEPTSDESDSEATIRIKLYQRYLNRIFDPSWHIHAEGNRVIVSRKK